MKQTVCILFLLLSIFLLSNVVFMTSTHAQSQRPERPKEAVIAPTVGIENTATAPKVRVWTDKGDNTNGNRPIYYVGEQIYVSFQVDKDCFVTIYDIDSMGNVNILFPNPQYRDSFVRAGRIYTIPSGSYGYNLVLRGPTGEESLFAIVSNSIYYHWQYEVSPPPIWAYEWGSPLTWGHSGGDDYSLASQRFQKRLQTQPVGSPDIAIEYIKSQARAKTPLSVNVAYQEQPIVPLEGPFDPTLPGRKRIWRAAQPLLQLKGKTRVGYSECRFDVIVPPY